MGLPPTSTDGYLPSGVHRATLEEIKSRFGSTFSRRQVLMGRFEEILRLARETGKLLRAFIWGSFVTAKPFPRDLDIFLLMREGFDHDLESLSPAQLGVFEHDRARLLFEADIFWATAAIGIEELDSWLSVYQLSRDAIQRGIVEVIFDD